jgi:hypothetical protein
MLFKDEKHKEFFVKNVEKTGSQKDPYRKALFYTLGLTNETRSNIDRLYNYKDRCIEFDGLKDSWQTGTSMRVTRLAFNLFNGFNGDIGEGDPLDNPNKYTPYELFDNCLMIFMLEAVKLLYQAYVPGTTEFHTLVSNLGLEGR